MLARFAVSSRSLHISAKNARGPLTFPGWYPRDHMPDKYPKTEEERRAAAIKYGLRPEDYKPISFDNVEDFAGNYPDLGFMTYDNKDPYEAYSYSLYRRNWGEPMQMSYITHRADRNSYTGLDIDDFTIWKFIKYSLFVVVPLGLGIYSISHPMKTSYYLKIPKMPKQYPYDYYPTFPYGDPTKYPIVNYSFESAE